MRHRYRLATTAFGLTVDTRTALPLLRSGAILAWGDNTFLQGYVGCVAPPSRYTSLAVGGYHAIALVNKHEFQGWGREINGISQVPSALQGKQWVALACGLLHDVALASDRMLYAWGDNSAGQCNVPPLPPGRSYTAKFWVGPGHAVAVRSDGTAIGWGDNTGGCSSIPTPPPGVTYVDADLNYQATLLLRSDGEIVGIGSPWAVHLPVPALPAGLRYVEVANAYTFSAALRSDGSVVHWGTGSQPLPMPLPVLPFGVCYVQVESGYQHMALRRSDGRVDPIGLLPQVHGYIPPLDPGTSYVEIAAAERIVAGRVGPTCTYVSFGHGCAGSRPATRLIPRDTPHLGKTLEITLFDLPLDLAFLVFGWQKAPAPIDLGFVGMPGCDLHVSLDAIVPIVGANTQAKWFLPIPGDPALVGTRFYNQALVPDPAAGNGFGAVVSDAAEAVIGHW